VGGCGAGGTHALRCTKVGATPTVGALREAKVAVGAADLSRAAFMFASICAFHSACASSAASSWSSSVDLSGFWNLFPRMRVRRRYGLNAKPKVPADAFLTTRIQMGSRWLVRAGFVHGALQDDGRLG
jgi:hypothetical protein